MQRPKSVIPIIIVAIPALVSLVLWLITASGSGLPPTVLYPLGFGILAAAIVSLFVGGFKTVRNKLIYGLLFVADICFGLLLLLLGYIVNHLKF